jgi:glycosyltransferase involved in cell wall biosynthesis/putative flippase GtrA
MRVAIVTEVWAPTVNGVVTRLEQCITELVGHGHDVLVVCPGVPGTLLTPHGQPWGERRAGGSLAVRTVPTIRVPFVYGGQPWGLPAIRVRRFLADFVPDVVHVVNPVWLGAAGVAAARRMRLPLVCSYHTDIATYASCYHLGWLRPLIRRYLRLLHGCATINLVTSATGAGQLQAAGVRRHEDGRGRIELWQRGVDLEQFRPQPIRSRVSAGGERKTIRALYVGRLADEKRLGDLKPLASAPGISLTLVGDGPARALLRETLGPDVIFRGVLRGRQLAAAYGDADVFVFPSTTDTLGLVLLEALASGLPVIAADSPASRELLGRCRAARLWRDGQSERAAALATELLASAPRSQLQRWARAEVEGRGWGAATRQLVGYYQQVRDTGDIRPEKRTTTSSQVHRFALVGALNAAIDVGLFNVFLLIHASRSPATLVVYNTVAVLAALTNRYAWNSRWTFRSRNNLQNRPWRQRVLFALCGGLNITINDLVVAGVTAILESATLSATVAGNLAKVAAMLTASAVSFLVMRTVVFRCHPPSAPASPREAQRSAARSTETQHTAA